MAKKIYTAAELRAKTEANKSNIQKLVQPAMENLAAKMDEAAGNGQTAILFYIDDSAIPMTDALKEAVKAELTKQNFRITKEPGELFERINW